MRGGGARPWWSWRSRVVGKGGRVQQTSVTALLPAWQWVWRTHLVRHFDAKKKHYDELIEQAKGYEDRAMKLDDLRKQLLYGAIYDRSPDRFRLSELVSKLDRQDAEWARK